MLTNEATAVIGTPKPNQIAHLSWEVPPRKLLSFPTLQEILLVDQKSGQKQSDL